MKNIMIISLVLMLISCNSKNEKGDVEKWKKEILDTEADFARMAKEKGIPEAFLFYADTNAVLMRNNKLIKGKKALTEYYETPSGPDQVELSWKPVFVDVSSSGDLGYTYGKYLYTLTDSTGNKNTSEGIFHTVWKKQSDGQWKFVWD